MRSLQPGDRSAYEDLQACWRDRIFTFLHRRTLNLTLAEEAHQETWLRVSQYRHKYDPERPFRAWLYTLACHASHDARGVDPRGFEWPGSEGRSLEVRDQVLAALQSLGPEDRRLILLIIGGFTTAEAAGILEIGHVAARRRLSRARERLREYHA